MKKYYCLAVLLFPLLQFSMQAQDDLSRSDFSHLTKLEISFEEAFIQSTINEEEEFSFGFKGNFKISKSGDHYIAESQTDLFTGTALQPKWKTQLTEKMLFALSAYIMVLEKAPKRTDVMGYNNVFYKAKYKGEKWYIKADRDIFNDFDDALSNSAPDIAFYTEIFKTQIENYYSEQRTHRAKTDRLISKKWYFNPSDLKSLKRASKIKLSSKPSEKAQHFWEITDDYKFNFSNAREGELDPVVRIQYNAEENLTDYMYLSIYSPGLVEREDAENENPRYTSFYILSLSEEELVLKIAY